MISFLCVDFAYLLLLLIKFNRCIPDKSIVVRSSFQQLHLLSLLLLLLLMTMLFCIRLCFFCFFFHSHYLQSRFVCRTVTNVHIASVCMYNFMNPDESTWMDSLHFSFSFCLFHWFALFIDLSFLLCVLRLGFVLVCRAAARNLTLFLDQLNALRPKMRKETREQGKRKKDKKSIVSVNHHSIESYCKGNRVLQSALAQLCMYSMGQTNIPLAKIHKTIEIFLSFSLITMFIILVRLGTPAEVTQVTV